jgi:hypothetical protein
MAALPEARESNAIGVADYQGHPHVFVSEWNEEADDFREGGSGAAMRRNLAPAIRDGNRRCLFNFEHGGDTNTVCTSQISSPQKIPD